MRLAERNTAFNGIPVHYWEGGAGSPLLMIHGSGPGASTLGNWGSILELLAARYHVIAADLIGFGSSGRKPAPPYFDMDLWLGQARAMLDLFGDTACAVLGHSVSASLALRLAASDKRINKVITTGAMGAAFVPNAHTVKAWTFPETREDLRRTAHALVYDKNMITDAYLDARMNILHSGDYAAYFSSMLKGDKSAYVDAAVVSEADLKAIACDVLMIHGRNDLPFPFAETTLKIAQALRSADVVVLANCGHSPALEHPAKLLALVDMFLKPAPEKA